MEPTLNFELAVYFSWTVSIVLFMMIAAKKPDLWVEIKPISLENPGKELLWGFVAVILLICISIGSDMALKPYKKDPDFGKLVFFGQLVLVYLPVFLTLKLRNQNLDTCFLSFQQLPKKIIFGMMLSLVASFIFLAIRGKADGYWEYLTLLGKGGPVAMLQTFMEGFGVGFILYRFTAWIGIRWSCVIVAILFMAAHIPNYTSGSYEFSLPIALLLAGAHAGIAIVIIYSMWKTQDIVVIGFLHWFINRATDFTS